MEEIEKIIEEETKEYKEKYGDDWLAFYLSNFRFNLPDDRFGWGGYYRSRIKGEEWNKKFKEIYTDKNSKLVGEQTPEEFYKTIDKALEEEGISLEKVKELQREDKIKELHELVFPVYKRLRKMGYKHYPDLTR